MKKFFLQFFGTFHWTRFLASIALVSALIWLISSCTSGAEQEYELTNLELATVKQVVSVVGSVEDELETTLAFQTSGLLKSVYVEEGQGVSSGQLLAELDTTSLELEVKRAEAEMELQEAQLDKLLSGLTEEERALLTSTVDNAKESLLSLDKTIDATKSRNQSEIESAKLRLAQAEEVLRATTDALNNATASDVATFEQALASAERNFEDIIWRDAKNIEAAKAAVKQAEVSLENVKRDRNANTPISDKNLADAQETTFYEASNLLDEVDRTLRSVNEIITVEEYNKDDNQAYRAQLGAKKLNSYNNTLTAYNALKNIYNKQRSLYVITADPLEYSEILLRLTTLRELLNQSYEVLSTTTLMLEHSLTSRDLTLDELNAFKDDILQQRSTISTSISTLATLTQKVENLELQKNSSTTSLDNAVASSVEAYNVAQENLEVTIATAQSNETTARNAVAQALDNLEKAKAGATLQQVDLVKLENSKEEAKRQLQTVIATVKEQEASLDANRTDLSGKLTQAQKDEAAKIAPARAEDIAVSRARLRQAEISLELAMERLEDARIYAPIDGVVGSFTLTVGEQIQAGSPVLMVLSDDVSTITTLVAETEIATVFIGQHVLFDFDAFSELEIYKGDVAYISPNKIDLDGVIYFEVKVSYNPRQFTNRIIRPGFSANLEIITKQEEGLSIPNGALREISENEYMVRLLVRNKIVEQPVRIGMVGEDRTIITDGLSEDDLIILSVITQNE